MMWIIMKLAIISITVSGQKIARQLANTLEMDLSIFKVDLYHKNVKKTLKDIFNDYDGILGIMASGIMIRIVCPHIQDKIRDPAILVMDEKSKHVISLLSGHHGGANDLTIKIAEICGADPVITTATDVNGKIGVDTLAWKYYMEIDQPSKALSINQALVDDKKVELAVPPRFEFLFEDRLIKNSYHKVLSSQGIEVILNGNNITLTPEKVVVGIGARKGISCRSVLLAVNTVCNDMRIPIERIDCLATAEPKENETGILEAAIKLGVNLEVVPLEKLRNFKHPQISESPFVRKKFGVPGICEPAALITAGANSSLKYRKKAVGKVTVALAVSAH